MQYRLLNTIGGKGSGQDKFNASLLGITADATGMVYAVGDQAVKVFESSGQFVRQWPLTRPGRCVVLDEDGMVHVGQAGQIEIFDSTGKRQSVWKDKTNLGLVTSIAHRDNCTFIGDAQARCIRRFDSQRKLLNRIGHDNRTQGFAIPNGQLDFSLDDDGVLHVAHPGKHRVERYSSNGELLGRFGHFGMRDPAHFRGCCNPTNLALMKDARVVVTEKAGPRAKVYDSQGKFLAIMDERFFDPNCRNMDVCVDGKDRIYVVDTVRLQICVFSATPEVTRGPSTPAVEGVVV
jgi:hypothetical protein